MTNHWGQNSRTTDWTSLDVKIAKPSCRGRQLRCPKGGGTLRPTALVKDLGLGGCIYCSLMSGFDLGTAFSVCTPGSLRPLSRTGCGELLLVGGGWCVGAVDDVDRGLWGISSIVQVTLPSEPLLLAWECSKKSPAKGPAPFVCSGFMVCWPPDPIWSSRLHRRRARASINYNRKSYCIRSVCHQAVLHYACEWPVRSIYI